MLPFIYAGVVSTLGVILGKRLAAAHQRSTGGLPRQTSASVRLLAHHVLEETNQVLATEEVPMDNRFGNKPLSSELEFSQTAAIALELGENNRVTTGSKTTLWRLMENRAELELGKSLGIEVGSQISRRVKLRFATDPGQFVRYRVVWQQQSQRGILELQAGRHVFQLPYLIAYGLSHTVESLPGESIDKRPKANHAAEESTEEEEE